MKYCTCMRSVKFVLNPTYILDLQVDSYILEIVKEVYTAPLAK